MYLKGTLLTDYTSVRSRRRDREVTLLTDYTSVRLCRHDREATLLTDYTSVRLHRHDREAGAGNPSPTPFKVTCSPCCPGIAGSSSRLSRLFFLGGEAVLVCLRLFLSEMRRQPGLSICRPPFSSVNVAQRVGPCSLGSGPGPAPEVDEV